MENETILYFSMFENLGYFRYLFFILGLILYCTILFFNVAIILVIYLEPTLHQPMYILISCLSLNSLYGTAGFFPRLLTDLLVYSHMISRPACHVQTFVIYTYASYEFTILTLMAYDRFVAISKPLRYHSIITPRVLIILIALSWIYPMFSIGIGIILTARLRLCGNEIKKLYCNNWIIAKLSCENAMIDNIYGFVVLITTVLIPLTFIIYSYFKILLICQKSSKEVRKKAYHTCLPHLVTFTNYSITIFCEMTFTRFENLHPAVAVILSLEFLIIPPLLNPLVYGLNFPDIRRKITNLKISKQSVHPQFAH
ncbi:putative gustatory receptor clone PTE03 [Colossoma macropomum]|uniref:putative gustatory receptor clone PTE03 n=1 Tax=Colossoma macropomum TaxID=42526 RepID=UPI00186490C2|nr:putative gustatory receptor clone PTE03 [Colossoma macropomum]